MKRTSANTSFGSGGVTSKLGALCFYSSVILVDPKASGCSETHPKAMPENFRAQSKKNQTANVTFGFADTQVNPF